MYNNAQNGYEWFENINVCYDSLVDDLSRDLFKARLEVDLGNSIKALGDLTKEFFINSENNLMDKFDWVREFSENNKPVYLYGAVNVGESMCRILKRAGVNVLGFFDKNYNTMDYVCGLPVLPPPLNQEALQNLPCDFYILICATRRENEIYNLLLESNFPKENILPRLEIKLNLENQYFDFIDHFDTSGAFVDAGCLNCDTSIKFSNIVNGEYSKIFAFEPDPNNFTTCEKISKEKNIRDFNLVKSGLSDTKTKAFFSSKSSGSSKLSKSGDTIIDLVTLDEIAKNDKISFIKMDIEGEELKALQGAENTIKRDKPLCAICVYHKCGDIAVIGSYLKKLVPEYRFAVRHYTSTTVETVLYAFL